MTFKTNIKDHFSSSVKRKFIKETYDLKNNDNKETQYFFI